MKIAIIGGGSFGTALAHQLSLNPKNDIKLLLRDKKLVKEINDDRVNSKYFPNRKLNTGIRATNDYEVLTESQVIFLAIPTASIPLLIPQITPFLTKSNPLIVNLAKGIFENGETVPDLLKRELNYKRVVTLKGASFSAEMINRVPTLFTLGFNQIKDFEVISELIHNTNIFIDSTTDIRGVELLSALKNIYSIILGIVDAQYNSANTRFLILTKAIAEIKVIVQALGGKEETILLGCGIGDTCLTGLNDLSRNRTLGLLIGKGFFTSANEHNSVVLEGIRTLAIINKIIPPKVKNRLPLFEQLFSSMVSKEIDKFHLNFEDLFRKRYKTILTYGTFDLIHYGHLELLRRAKELGDRLIVGLSTDEFNTLKGKECAMSFEKRRQYLESIQYVDLVIPETNWDQKIEDVKKYKVDTFVMGDDWEGKFDFLKDYCEVVYLKRTKGISTTSLKKIRKEKGL